jgi:hypothetical protein
MLRRTLCVLAASCGAASARAQFSAGAGLATVRYAGGSSLTPSLSSTLSYAAPIVTANLSSALALLPRNVLYSQGRADLWAATPPLGEPHLRLGVEGLWSGTALSDGSRTATAQGVVEALWSTPTWGLGVGGGPSWGWILAQPPSVTALHLRARAWWQRGTTNTTVTVEPTRFFGAWFTDVTASVTLTRENSKVVASVVVGGRLSRAYVSKGMGSAFLQYYVTPALAIEGGGGAYLPDPYQGFPRAGYIAAGVRWFPPARHAATAAATKTAPPLVPYRRGDSLFVRFRMPGAKRVAIAGEWNRWTPTLLQAVGDDLWEGAVTLPPGTYRFNLLVDGSDWVVPAGVATLSDGLGGLVALLVVP